MIALHRAYELSQGFLSESVALLCRHTHCPEHRLDRRQLDDIFAFADPDRTIGLEAQILFRTLHSQPGHGGDEEAPRLG